MMVMKMMMVLMTMVITTASTPTVASSFIVSVLTARYIVRVSWVLSYNCHINLRLVLSWLLFQT